MSKLRHWFRCWKLGVPLSTSPEALVLGIRKLVAQWGVRTADLSDAEVEESVLGFATSCRNLGIDFPSLLRDAIQ